MNSKFSCIRTICLLMYSIFHWILTILNIQRIWIFPRIRNFDTSNVHNFPLHLHDFVHWMYSNFSTNSEVLYMKVHFQLNFHDIFHSRNSIYLFIYFFYESGPSVHLMYTIFLWIFSISFIQQISIFSRIWTFYTSNVHNFPLNFQDIIHLTNLNFSMYSDYLSI